MCCIRISQIEDCMKKKTNERFSRHFAFFFIYSYRIKQNYENKVEIKSFPL